MRRTRPILVVEVTDDKGVFLSRRIFNNQDEAEDYVQQVTQKPYTKVFWWEM